MINKKQEIRNKTFVHLICLDPLVVRAVYLHLSHVTLHNHVTKDKKVKFLSGIISQHLKIFTLHDDEVTEDKKELSFFLELYLNIFTLDDNIYSPVTEDNKK